MGIFLDERFGEEQLVVGFATSSGEYYAVGKGGGGQGAFEPQEPPADRLEAVLVRPRLVVDLPPAEPDDDGGWLHEPLPMRSVRDLELDRQFFSSPVARDDDPVGGLRETTAARQLSWRAR